MNLKQFTDSIEFIKELREIEKNLEKAFSGLNQNHNYGMLGTVETQYLKLLEIAMEDKYQWISYFIYDCEFGKDPRTVTPNKGKSFNLKTITQLYKLLTS